MTGEQDTAGRRSIERELKRGTVELIVLHVLEPGEAYGYEIADKLAARTDGTLDVKEGTLYPVLYRLERAGLVATRWDTPARGVPRRAIHIASGPEYFAANTLFHDAVRDRTVTHLATEGQQVLDESVAVSDKKQVGNSGSWRWVATTPDGDETPTEAVSLAHWAAKTTKRRPGRKAVGVVL